MSDTIAALATAPGRAALAIVRISGPGTAPILWELTGVPISARRASVRRLKHDGMLIDEALVLWMPGPNSYTGEDMAELAAMVDDGRVRPAVDSVFPLDDAASAMEYLLSGRACGKLVVTVGTGR